MRIPYQSGGVERGPARGVERPGVLAAGLAPSVLARAAIGGLGSLAGGRALGFACNPLFCACKGDSDCNDMFTTNVCGPRAICIDDVCYCLRN